MASETVISDHSVTSKEVEKEVQSEVMKIEGEKESAKNTNAEESACLAGPSAESDSKIEEKQVKPPVIQDVKDTCADDKPKAISAESTEDKDGDKRVETPPPAEDDNKIEVAAPLAESAQEKVEDKPIGPPPTEKEKKTEGSPPLEPCDKGAHEVANETIPAPNAAAILEPTIEKTDSKSEPEPAEKYAVETNVEFIEKKPKETEEVVDVPESLPTEVIGEKKGTSEDLPAKVVEAVEAKDVIVTEAECKPAETSEPVPIVEETLEETEVKNPADKVEDTKLQKEEETCPSESTDEIKSEATQVEEKHAESNPTDEVSENTGEVNEATKPTKETTKVTGLSEQKAIEPGKIEAETEALKEKNVVAEEMIQCQERPTDDVKIPVPQVAEKVAEEEGTSRDIQLVEDKGSSKVETVSSDETTNAETEVKEDTEAPNLKDKTEAAEKKEQTVQATETKLEEVKQVVEKIEETVQYAEAKKEEKQAHEPAETDVQNPEFAKDREDIITSQDAPTVVVPVKTQKQSIVKIVKQSIVKAKKAIIGKSQNIKPPASEPKDAGNK